MEKGIFRIVGFCFIPIGGIIILFLFSDLVGSVANLISDDFDSGIAVKNLYKNSPTLLLGLFLFGVGVHFLKGEIGIVFLSLGAVVFVVSLLPIIVRFFGFSASSTPHSIGKFIGQCIVLLWGVVLFYVGIRSFSQQKDETIIDDIK